MKDYSNYHPPLHEVILDDGKFIFEQQLLGSEGKDVLVDGMPTRALVQYHTNPMSDEKEDRKIKCWNDVEIKRGSIVKMLESDEDYIVVTKVKQNDLIKYTKILYCNNTLTFQDTTTLTIHTLPCVLTDKTSVYSDGIYENKHLTLADDQIMITIPSNNTTNKIPKNKRFIFNHDEESVYESTKIDKLTKNGLIHIVMRHNEYDPNKDNLELNIADYIKPDEQTPPEQPENPTEDNYTIQIIGQDSINVITNGTYTTKVYNNGVEVDKEIRFEISDTSLATIKSQDGKGCVVVANPNFKQGEVKLKAILVEDESAYTEKTIAVLGL